jgi:putative endonuclease
MSGPGRAAFGAQGEDAAARWYEGASYEILARNWRCPEGEVDLVVRSAAGDVVVFCEVKARASERFGSPYEAVTAAKQRRLRRLATRWLESERPGGRRYRQVRFDVAAVTRGPGGVLVVEVLEDAF